MPELSALTDILMGKDVLSLLHILVVLPSGYKHLHAFLLKAGSEAAELWPPLTADMWLSAVDSDS